MKQLINTRCQNIGGIAVLTSLVDGDLASLERVVDSLLNRSGFGVAVAFVEGANQELKMFGLESVLQCAYKYGSGDVSTVSLLLRSPGPGIFVHELDIFSFSVPDRTTKASGGEPFDRKVADVQGTFQHIRQKVIERLAALEWKSI
jgi:hypothetical protein